MVRTRAAVFVAVVLSGCKVGFDAPADARITCSSDAECPGGWFCKPALGRCSQSHDDGSPPTLHGAATVTPGFASRGTLVTVQFEASEPLGVLPVIELNTAPARTPFLLYSQNGLVYTYALAVGPAVSEGTYSVLARLVSATGAVAQDLALGTVQVDATPPEITRIDVLTPRVRAGQGALVEATFGEALTVAPRARVLAGPAMVTVPTAQANVWRFRLDVTGTELEGSMSVEVDAQDGAGNAATRTATDAFVLDFTAPALATAALVETPVVRSGQQIVVDLQFTEPLAAPPAVRLRGPGSETLSLAVADQVGAAYTFGATVQPSTPEVTYGLEITAFADVAGNPGADVTNGGAVRVDSTPPHLDAGPTAVGKPGARYRAGDAPSFTLTVSEPLARPPSASLTTSPAVPLSCTGGAGNAWTCTAPSALTGAETPESAVKAIFDVVDLAGNPATFSADATLDFHAPDVAPGTVGLDLTPPAGALVSSVTALRAGARARVSFTVTEPLATDPVVLTTTAPAPALTFSKASQSGTFYVYEHVLDGGAHGQGSYTVVAQLTDLAGNVATRTLAVPAPGVVVDTVPPLSPDVATTAIIVYARAPWGTAATGGAPRFTITGAAGAVEAGATVVAFDDDYLTSAREIGRATATGAGAFGPMALVPADRREVFVVAVDGAGNGSDASGAAGTQAVRVRDVSWTATLLGKVAGSTAENPHQLESRSRWLGALEQGASAEVTLPASTRGSLAWTLAASNLWASGKAAADTRRGRLVVPTAAAVWEWDGEAWSSVTASGGPQEITAVTYDARRGEVLVYEGRCAGGTTLWAWRGAGWEPRAQGGSYVEWFYYHAPAPGPHRAAYLAYDEARGEVILAAGKQAYMGLPCGDVAGAMDYGSYAWNGSAWRALPGPGGDGRLLGYDAGRQVALRVTSTSAQEWDGSVWTTIDPAGITTGPLAASACDTVYDPTVGRILCQADGAVWSWSGTSWRRDGASATGTLVRDAAQDWALLLTTTGIQRWAAGTGWIVRTAAGTIPPSPAGVAYSTTRGRMEAFDDSGTVYRWSSGTWWPISSATHPPGVSAAAALDASGSQALAYATDMGTWRWDGSNWTSLTPADGTRPSGNRGMAWVSGAGPVAVGNNGYIYEWSDRWFRPANGNGYSATAAGPAAMAGQAGVYFLYKQLLSNPDWYLAAWTPAGGYQSVYSAAGRGSIAPVAADASGRTFVLQRYGTLLLSGSTLVPAGVEDPRGVGFPIAVDASAWDPVQNAVVVLDGPRTWWLETEPRSRPGQLFRVAWPAGTGAGGDCFEPAGTCRVRSVDVTWRGSLAANEGASGSTATLSLWNQSRWIPVASASGSAGAQASASAPVTDAALLRLLASGQQPEIDLAIVLPASGLTAPLLRTDDLSLTVTYRLP